jgi:hypothetical protein
LGKLLQNVLAQIAIIDPLSAAIGNFERIPREMVSHTEPDGRFCFAG